MPVPPPASSEPPPRPDAAPGSLHREWRWWPALASLAAIVVVVSGGYVTAAALSEPVRLPIGIDGVVSVRPLSGWLLADRGSFDGAPFIRLTRGSGNLDVVAFAPTEDTPDGLAAEYRDVVLSAQLSQLSVSGDLERVRLTSGAQSVRFAYVGVVADTGAAIEGEVTVLVTASGTGLVFDGWAPEGLLSFVLTDIRTMVERAEVA